MNTQTFQVFQLRGMDERWISEANDALYVQDMTWMSTDSWRTSGGWHPYFRQSPYYNVEYTETENEVEYPSNSDDDTEPQSPIGPSGTVTITETVTTIDSITPVAYPSVRSIHWFAQHNGARQFIVYEQQTFDPAKKMINEGRLELRYFDGSRNAAEYSSSYDFEACRVMVQFARKRTNTIGNADIGEGLNAIKNRFDAGLAIPTQSQAWGGRLYMVNGHQRPIVFNGEYIERAGFENPPSPPQASAGEFFDTSTFCFGVGNPVTGESAVKKGRHGLFDDYTYWGMGPKSFAEFGVGKYFVASQSLYSTTRRDLRESSHAGTPDYSLHDSDLKIQGALHLNQQVDRRRVGWQYKITYVNERGQESESSEASNVAMFLNGTGQWNQHGKAFVTVHISRGPSECVARRIYRSRNLYDSNGSMVSMGASTRFYFLKEIQDNMTEMFIDGHPDTSLGSLLATRQLGKFPPGTRFLASFKNTMFAAGGTNNTIYFSAPNFPESFPDLNVLHIGDDDGGPITGMRATKNSLVVFKSRGIYLIKGNPFDGFSAQTLNKDIGCWAPNSIAEAPGLGLIFLSERHVCLLEGALENTGTITNIVKLSTEIPHQMEKLNTSAAIRAVGAVYLKDNEYWLSIPTQGSSKNNLLLVYHYMVGSWSVRHNIPVACAVHSNDHRGYLFFGLERPDPDDVSFTGETTTYEDFTVSAIPGSTIGSAILDTAGLTAVSGLLPADSGGTTEELSGGTPEELSGGTGSPTYGGAYANVSGIAVYSRGYPTKGLTWKVDPIYTTANLPFGSVYKTTHPSHLMVYGVGYGDNNMSINYRVNRSLFNIRDKRQPADQQDPNERYPVYGTAKWDDDYWGEYRPTVIRYDVSTTHKGPVREVGITIATSEDSASGTKIEIVGYDIEAKVGEQRNIKPLNEALRPDRR